MPGEREGEIACEVTGLLPRQKQAITVSWQLVGQNSKQNGVDLFVR